MGLWLRLIKKNMKCSAVDFFQCGAVLLGPPFASRDACRSVRFAQAAANLLRTVIMTQRNAICAMGECVRELVENGGYDRAEPVPDLDEEDAPWVCPQCSHFLCANADMEEAIQ